MEKCRRIYLICLEILLGKKCYHYKMQSEEQQGCKQSRRLETSARYHYITWMLDWLAKGDILLDLLCQTRNHFVQLDVIINL